MITYSRELLSCLQLGSFGAKDIDMGSACIGVTCVGDICARDIYIRGAYIKSTYIESLCAKNACYAKNAYIGSICDMNTCIGSTCISNVGAVKCLGIHVQSSQILKIEGAKLEIRIRAG